MATHVKKVLAGPLTANGEGPAGVAFVGPDGSVFGSVSLADVPAAMLTRLALHGISQKVGDSYANAAKAENPLTFVRDAIKETIEQIVKGEWRITTAGGIRVSLLARALARATGKTPEEAQGVIDLYSDLDDEGEPSEAGKAWLKNIKAQDAIKAATAAIKLEDNEKAKARLAERAAKGGDAADLGALFQ